MKPKAMIFDVFGTVVDWRTGVSTFSEGFLKPRGFHIDYNAFADAWRGQYQPAMEKIRSGGRGYVSLDLLHRENLDAIIPQFGLDALSEDDRDALNHAWEHLPPWDDSVPGLNALHAHAILAPCSNGSIALMSRLKRFGSLPWDAIVGAEIAKDYKPQLGVYIASCNALGCKADEVMMVAAHNDDLFAAREAGLLTAFLPRPTEYGTGQKTDLTHESDWTIVATDMIDLARQIDQ